MSRITYTAGIWPGNEAERPRYAVLGPTGCWIFPERYGREAAERLARAMNQDMEEAA